MRLGALSVLGLALSLSGQNYTVRDLASPDWQVRNRAAVALIAVSSLDDHALLAAIVAESAPPLPRRPDAIGRYGGRIRPDAVEDFVRSQRAAVAGNRGDADLLPHPVVVTDLVVPFDARALAAFVALERGLDPVAVATACVALLAVDEPQVQAAAASALWRLGDSAKAVRQKALRSPRFAGSLARVAVDGGAAAAVELAAVLAIDDDALRTLVLDGLWIEHAQGDAALLQSVVDCFFAAGDETSLRAGALLRQAGAAGVPALVKVLQQPANAARAAGMLFALGEASLPAGPALLRVVADGEADPLARTRAALALGEIGKAVEAIDAPLASEIAGVLYGLFSDRATKGEFGLAVTYALGGYPTSLPTLATAKLEEMTRAWLPRVRHGELAALHALQRSGRLATLPVDRLQALWTAQRRTSLRSSLECAIALHGLEAEPVLRSIALQSERLALDAEATSAAADVLRGWLDQPELPLLAVAIHCLSQLGPRAGVEGARVRAFADSKLAADVRAAALRWSAELDDGEDHREWLLQRLHLLDASAARIDLVVGLDLSAERRDEVLLALLANADESGWRAHSLAAAVVRRLASRLVASDGGERTRLAVQALARCGVSTAEDTRLLAHAIASDPTPTLFAAFLEAPSMPVALREASAEAITVEGDAETVAAAIRCVWTHRTR